MQKHNLIFLHPHTTHLPHENTYETLPQVFKKYSHLLSKTYNPPRWKTICFIWSSFDVLRQFQCSHFECERGEYGGVGNLIKFLPADLSCLLSVGSYGFIRKHSRLMVIANPMTLTEDEYAEYYVVTSLCGRNGWQPC